MSMPVVSNAVPVTPPLSKPPRNPWERVAVWGIIGLLLVVVLIEYRAARGHAATINALNDFAANENSETKLADAMQLLAMAPAINGPVAFGPYDHYHCSWLSVFKPGQYKVTLVASREEKPELLLFITPQPPAEPILEEEPAAEGASTRPSTGMASRGMDGPGMGMGMGGSGMGGGGARQPNPVRGAMDSDNDGGFSAAEIAAAPAALAKLDTDANGSLSVEELTSPPLAAADRRAADGTVAPAPSTGSGSARPNRLVEAIDTNGDGAISPEELATAANGLKTLDADGDGKISSDELRPPGGGGGFGGGPPVGGTSGRPRRPGSEDASPASTESTSPPAATVPEVTEPQPAQGDLEKSPAAIGTP